MRSFFIVSALVAASCGGPLDATIPEADDEVGASALGLSLSAADQARVLSRVNYPGTSVAVLDDEAGLDGRAARGIVARRDGADGREATRDDVPFTSIAALDAVPYVGDAAFSKLLAFAKRAPAPADQTVEGVRFTGWEAETVLWAANAAPVGVFNGLLDNRAAANLVAARPFTSLTAVGAVSLIGSGALTAMRGQARTWWPAMRKAPAPVSLAGTFDGVSFDEATAKEALRLANEATTASFAANGVTAGAATAIVGARPFSSLGDVAAVKGVGSATMQALQRWASGAGVDEVAALRAKLEPLVVDLWFPSETDAKLLFVSASGIGTAPITEALLRQTLTAQHDALLPQVMWVDPAQVPLATRTVVERRDAVGYLNRVIDNADPADPVSQEAARRFGVLRDALTGELTDLVMFRFGTVNISTFIVGRTPGGALVGFLTGQVET